jgi:DNA replication protein DnaC
VHGDECQRNRDERAAAEAVAATRQEDDEHEDRREHELDEERSRNIASETTGLKWPPRHLAERVEAREQGEPERERRDQENRSAGPSRGDNGGRPADYTRPMPGKGAFFLGTTVDPANPKAVGEHLALDSSDLTTHGVIVGMTGSGKTGLAIVLLEEALLAGIPVLVLDPKGDMGNLALRFPNLEAADFKPWVNESDATAAGLSVDEYAEQTAANWKQGLESNGIGAERIQQLRDAADLTIYTPGSSAGVPLNVVGSLRAPPLSWDSEAETLRDEIEGVVTSLLTLIGVHAAPLWSREHVLLSNLIENAWRSGRDLDLASLIGEIQSPPLRKLGVFEVDAFFPPKERTELALQLNSLVAAPSFAAWGEGPPIDMQSILLTPEGRPRTAIVYLAHLSEEERQFVVTLVLSKLVTWMRGQSGTSELRTLAYMDEVFGYVPPTAAPPAKKPILTILKQGRAFGVGIVLSTQNPVDLDYKAMANAGTWMVGRLQTANDKARVLEGLKSAAGGTDVGALDAAIGGLDKRQFLLVSAKSSTPRLFATRWAMSYLRGPLTKDQVELLVKEAAAASVPQPTAAAPAAAPAPELADDETRVAPGAADGVPVRYLDPAAPWAASVGASNDGKRMRAFVTARVSMRYDDTAAGIDEAEEFEAFYGPLEDGLDLEDETVVDYDDRDLGTEAPAEATYVIPSAPITKGSFFRDAEKEIRSRIVDKRTMEIFRNQTLKLTSRPGESEEDFRKRCDDAAQSKADEETAKVTARLKARQDRLQSALELAQRRVEELDAETKSRSTNELVAGAGAVLGALLGGRRSARSIATAVSGASSRRGTTARAEERRRTAQERVAQKGDELEALEQELLDEVERIDASWRERAEAVETASIRLEATDVRVAQLALVWVPTTS